MRRREELEALLVEFERRGGAAGANGADLTGVDPPYEGPHQSTAALLRKLGAIE